MAQIQSLAQERPYAAGAVTYLFIYLLIYLFCLFAISRAAPAAYGGSQARGPFGAVAVCLCHSNAGSEPRLQPTPQLTAVPDP